MSEKGAGYSLEESEYIIKNAYIPKGKYTLFDWILLLFYAEPNRPIDGKARLTNEMFLMYNQIITNLLFYVDLYVSFVENPSGVYSKEVEDAVDDLVFLKYVEISNRQDETDQLETMTLTLKGIDYIKDESKDLPTELNDLLSHKRMEWDEFTMQVLTERVHDEFPQYSLFKRINAILWTKRGDEYLYKLNNYDHAIMYYNKALELNPSFGVVWMYKGEALFLKAMGLQEPTVYQKRAIKNFDIAIELLMKKRDLNNAAAAYYKKGFCLLNMGNNNEGRQHLDKALELSNEAIRNDPKDKIAWLVRGIIQDIIGNKDEAIDSFKKALEIDPNYEAAKVHKEEVERELRESINNSTGDS